ncbi:MAG: universal stress protein [Myxococcota bacterium]
MSDYEQIVVPYDFSAHSRAALATASDLARRLGAKLHLVHVILQPSFSYGHGGYGAAAAPPPPVMPELREQAEASLRDVAAGVAGPLAAEPHVLEGGDVTETLLLAAEKLGADLIVMGTHGRTGLAHVFLGSVTERMLRRAPCPVLGVQAPEEDA